MAGVWLFFRNGLLNLVAEATANIYINMTSELHAHDHNVLQQYEQELSAMMTEVTDE